MYCLSGSWSRHHTAKGLFFLLYEFSSKKFCFFSSFLKQYFFGRPYPPLSNSFLLMPSGSSYLTFLMEKSSVLAMSGFIFYPFIKSSCINPCPAEKIDTPITDCQPIRLPVRYRFCSKFIDGIANSAVPDHLKIAIWSWCTQQDKTNTGSARHRLNSKQYLLQFCGIWSGSTVWCSTPNTPKTLYNMIRYMILLDITRL